MFPSQTYEPRNVEADVGYWKERKDGSLPAGPKEGTKIMMAGKDMDATKVTIYDLHNIEDEFTLDKNGFQVVHSDRTPIYSKKDDRIKANEYPIWEALIKKLTGALWVEISMHVIRDIEKSDPSHPEYGPGVKKGPAYRPHADFEPHTISKFLSMVQPRYAEHVESGKRWQIIGIWRPLKPIQRNPLAMLDALTVQEGDFVSVPREYGSGRISANSILKKGDPGRHRWYYLPEQQPDEVFLFKHFDSWDQEGLVRRCAHTAFSLPGTNHLPPRESLEMRAFVGYDE